MLVLLVVSGALASSIFGRVKALLWGMLCAISMGSVVEVYQLRNEFFSSFLFIAASLLSVVSVRASFAANKREQWRSRSWPLLGCLLVYLLFWISFLAKVQIFPLIIIFNEIDTALIKIHKGIAPHEKIPIVVQDKTGWNGMLDNVERRMYQDIIIIMTSNRDPEFIDALDPSYIREGRVDLIVEMKERFNRLKN
jgi:hypothetical protein